MNVLYGFCIIRSEKINLIFFGTFKWESSSKIEHEYLSTVVELPFVEQIDTDL